MFGKFTGIILSAFIACTGLAHAQVTFELPVEASNCAIYRALLNNPNLVCNTPKHLGAPRGIVLRLDDELAAQQQEDLTDIIRKPALPTQKPVVKKTAAKATVKTAALSPKIDRAAAKSQGGYYIQFAFGSFDLEPNFQDHLARLGKVLKTPAMANTCIRVTGHTDTVGSADYNKKLSENRAVIVATKLAEASNISPDRIQIAAAGETRPLPNIDGSDPLNRRVEFSTKESKDGCNS